MTSPQDYVDAGLRILPVDLATKAPVMSGFGAHAPDFCADPAEFEQGETPAILCGPCPAGGDKWLVCLDLDGGLQLRDVEQILGPLPPTLTSHGGAHVFYWVEPGPERDQIMQWTDVFGARRPDDKANGRKAAALDLKWSGGYAIERDDWDQPFDVARIATLPGPAVAGLVSHGRKGNARSELPFQAPVDGSWNHDGLENQGQWPGGTERIVRFLESRPTDTAGDGGAGLFSVCCQLRAQFRLDSQTMFEALRSVYCPRIPDPWRDDQLWHKIEDSKAGSLRGGWTQGEMIPEEIRAQLRAEHAAVNPTFAAQVENEEREAQGQSPFIDVAERLKEGVKPVAWVCERLRLAPGRPNMLYSHAHGGKSLATVELAVSAATGARAFGDIEIGRCRVCYIENEDEYDLLMNADRICRGRKLTLEPGAFVILPRRIYLGQNEEQFQASCIALETIFETFKLVFVNSLRALTPGTEENSSLFARPLEVLGALSEKHQTTVVVNHHVNKTSGGPRGTTAIEAAEGNAWTLTKEDGAYLWTHTGVRMGSQQPGFELQLLRFQSPPLSNAADSDGIAFRRAVPRTEAAVAKENVGKTCELIKARLLGAGRWMRRTEVLSDLGVKPQTARDALSKLVNEHQIGTKREGQSSMYHHDPKASPLS